MITLHHPTDGTLFPCQIFVPSSLKSRLYSCNPIDGIVQMAISEIELAYSDHHTLGTVRFIVRTQLHRLGPSGVTKHLIGDSQLKEYEG